MGQSVCPACGKEHEIEVVDSPIPMRTCPNLPECWIYEDRVYKRGPRGAMHELKEDDDG